MSSLEDQIKKVEDQIETCTDLEERRQLRETERQLREERLILLKSQHAAGKFIDFTSITCLDEFVRHHLFALDSSF